MKSIDALSRDQLRALLVRLNLQNLAVPVVIPGANRWVPSLFRIQEAVGLQWRWLGCP